MDATVPSARALSAALQTAGRLVPGRAMTPALAHFLLEARDGHVFVTGGDLENYAMLPVPADVKAEGALLVPASLLKPLVAGMKDKPCSLALDGERVRVEGGGTRAKLPVLAAEDYPRPHPAPDVPAEPLPLADLTRAVERTAWAASTELTRPIMMALCLMPTEDGIEVVATNGHVIAVVPLAAHLSAETLLPPEALSAALAACEGQAETVELRRGESHLYLSCGMASAVVRMVEGPYPNYRMMLPQPEMEVGFAVLDAGEVREASAACMVVGPSEKSIHYVRLELGRTTARVFAQGNGNEAVAVRVTVPTLPAEPYAPPFNADYIRSALAACGTERVRFGWGASMNMPHTFRAEPEDGALFAAMTLRADSPRFGSWPAPIED